MSPPRLGLRRSTFNYFEDTLEIARLHIATAHCSSRKRQRRAGTAPISGSRLQGYPLRWILSRDRCIGWFGRMSEVLEVGRQHRCREPRLIRALRPQLKLDRAFRNLGQQCRRANS